MDDLNYYDLIDYWDLTIKQKTADGTFQNMLHDATIKWFNNNHFEGTIIQQQSGASYKILSGYATNGPFDIGTMAFDVIADDGSVKNFHGAIIDEWSIFGYCTSKDEEQIHGIKVAWSAFRYKKICHKNEDDNDDDDETATCPYCKAKLPESECEHVVAFVSHNWGDYNPSWFNVDIKLKDIDNPVRKLKLPDFKWTKETLKDSLGNFYDVIEAWEWGISDACFDHEIYFERLMAKTTCDYQCSSYVEGDSPAGCFSGSVYFAKDLNDVHKQLKKTIRKVDRCFKKLTDIMNKENAECPYCGVKYKSDKCEHYLADTNRKSFKINLDYPKLTDKYKNKIWEKDNLINMFGDLYSTLETYDKGFSKEPDKIAYFENLMQKVTCGYSHCRFDKGNVYYTRDVQAVIKQLSELSKRLAWLFKGLVYTEEIKSKERTKSRK